MDRDSKGRAALLLAFRPPSLPPSSLSRSLPPIHPPRQQSPVACIHPPPVRPGGRLPALIRYIHLCRPHPALQSVHPAGPPRRSRAAATRTATPSRHGLAAVSGACGRTSGSARRRPAAPPAGSAAPCNRVRRPVAQAANVHPCPCRVTLDWTALPARGTGGPAVWQAHDFFIFLFFWTRCTAPRLAHMPAARGGHRDASSGQGVICPSGAQARARRRCSGLDGMKRKEETLLFFGGCGATPDGSWVGDRGADQ